VKIDLKEAYRLYRTLSDEEEFEKLSLKEKLEALRLHTIQTIHNKNEVEIYET
jgi:hypothetical protein